MFKSSYNKRTFRLSSWEKNDKKSRLKTPLNERIVFDSLAATERKVSPKAQLFYGIVLLMIFATFYFLGFPTKEVKVIKIDDALIEKQ